MVGTTVPVEREPISAHDFITVPELAALMRVSEWTARSWCREGRVKAVYLGKTGYRISKREVRRVKRHGLREVADERE